MHCNTGIRLRLVRRFARAFWSFFKVEFSFLINADKDFETPLLKKQLLICKTEKNFLKRLTKYFSVWLCLL